MVKLMETNGRILSHSNRLCAAAQIVKLKRVIVKLKRVFIKLIVATQ